MTMRLGVAACKREQSSTSDDKPILAPRLSPTVQRYRLCTPPFFEVILDAITQTSGEESLRSKQKRAGFDSIDPLKMPGFRDHSDDWLE